MSRTRFLEILALILVYACWAGVFISVWFRVDGYQWDFKTYFYASRAIDDGLNPYKISDLSKVAGEESRPFKYVYPLHALYLFKPLANLDYAAAHRVWLLVKLVTIMALLLVWKRAFLSDVKWLWILVFGLFAFRGATIWDIKAGNVSALEQLFLWSGFAFLARGRHAAAALLITAAAFFKLTLAVFLVLLLRPWIPRPRGLLLIGSCLLMLGLIMAASFAAHPGYFSDFADSVRATPAWLESNPGAFGLAAELLRQHPGLFGGSPFVPYAIWFLFCLFILLTGRRVLTDAWRSTSPTVSIMVACLCYILLVPRTMIYSYMMVVVPTLALIFPIARRRDYGIYALAMLICFEGLQVLPAGIGNVLHDVGPFLVLLFCWLLLVADKQPHTAISR